MTRNPVGPGTPPDHTRPEHGGVPARKSGVSHLILHLHPRVVPEKTLRFRHTFGLGGSSVVLVMLLVSTGVLLLFVYEPSAERAYDSVLGLRDDIPFGQFIRNLHRWGANLLVVLAFLHLLRVFFTGAYRPPRSGNWIVGVILLFLVVGSNFTGYLLPWDQLSYWAVTICTSMLDYVPLIGAPLQQMLRGGPEIGPRTLSIFFVLHIVFVNGAAEFLRQTVSNLPKHIRIGLVRGDSGFGDSSVVECAGKLGLNYIFVARLTQNVQSLCRHDDAAWHRTEMGGLEVQEVPWHRAGQRLIVVRQRISQRPQAGGKELLEVPGYRFQSFITNLPTLVSALEVWRRYNGRADLENRIKELGDQFGIKRLCVASFWGTEALHHLAIVAYNLFVLLQRKLGQLELCQLNTLRWRLFSRAAVWSRAQGKPSLKLAVRGEENANELP